MKRLTLASSFVLVLLATGCDSSPAAGDDDAGGGGDGGTTSDGGTVTSDGGTGYTETVCSDPLASLADLQAAYQNTAAGIRAAALGIADRRYPIGRLFIEHETDSDLARWFQTTANFAGILDGFDTAVHEGQHGWDISMIANGRWPYRIREDLIIRPLRLTNFARSEIVALHVDAANDFYLNVYLTGQSGTQGFNNLLDEYNAYTHSLASRYCTRDSLPGGTRVTARDGILTMMYYVELYLKVARTNHPADYAAIKADPEHVRLILTIWDRAEFWLARSASTASLGIKDATIRTWVYDPANKMEIDLLRTP